MIRPVSKSQITPDKLLKADSTVKICSKSCNGCGECCRNHGGSRILLDSFDVDLFKRGFEKTFQQLINEGIIELIPVDDIVLPSLGVKEGSGECVFLSQEGRCMIHKIRPGICRLFPLARIYHPDGSFSYFLQEGECQYIDEGEVKVSEWIGWNNIEGYEAKVRAYHDKLVELRKACAAEKDEDELVRLKRQFLIDNFVN